MTGFREKPVTRGEAVSAIDSEENAWDVYQACCLKEHTSKTCTYTDAQSADGTNGSRCVYFQRR